MHMTPIQCQQLIDAALAMRDRAWGPRRDNRQMRVAYCYGTASAFRMTRNHSPLTIMRRWRPSALPLPRGNGKAADAQPKAAKANCQG